MVGSKFTNCLRFRQRGNADSTNKNMYVSPIVFFSIDFSSIIMFVHLFFPNVFFYF